MVAVPVRVDTRLFGTLSLDFTVHVIDGRRRRGTRVAWSRSLAFPGLRPGELLSRRTTLPRRATLLARDGSVLAESPAERKPAGQRSEQLRSHPQLAARRSGQRGARHRRADPRRRGAQALEAQGVPPKATVGLSGLELALDDRLRGTPGRRAAGGAARLLAYAAPHPAPAVRTTVSPALQRAAVTALGGQLGGIVAMQPSTGQILAVAGIGLDGLQPPGSTFKMVTLTGVLAGEDRHRTHRLPLRDVRDARRGEAEQRQRRGMRRLAGTGLRGLVQLGVHAARGQARRGAPGGDGRTLRLQPATRGSPARPRARCPRPPRSRANSTSAPRRSARARCWPRRWRWPRWRRPSPTADDADADLPPGPRSRRSARS